MTLTNPSAVITQLDVQLTACASWPGGMTTWYPKKTGATADLPYAVLAETSRGVRPYAAGAGGIAGGVLEVHLHVTGTIGAVETLARTLLDELLAQQSGIVFNSSECGLSNEPTPGEIAAGEDITSITMSLPWGLNV